MKPKKFGPKKRNSRALPSSTNWGRRKETANIMPRSLSISRRRLSPNGQLPRLKQGHNDLSRMAAKLCHDVPIPLKDFMGELEKEVILLVLHKVGGNQRGAANILGMKHTTLHQKLKRYQIRVRKTLSIE